jgi:hypothetical protein
MGTGRDVREAGLGRVTDECGQIELARIGDARVVHQGRGAAAPSMECIRLGSPKDRTDAPKQGQEPGHFSETYLR